MFNLGELFLFALSARLFIYLFIYFWGGLAKGSRMQGCEDGAKSER